MLNRFRRCRLVLACSLVPLGTTLLPGSVGAQAAPSEAPIDAADPGIDLGVPDPEVAMPEATPSASSSGRVTTTATTKPRTTTVSNSATGFFGMAPVRLLDTRGVARLQPNVPVTIVIAGANGVPATAVAAAVNVTITEPAATGYATAVPCGTNAETSTLNFTAARTVANLAVVPLGAGGAICVTSSTEANLIVDLSGYAAKGGQLFSPVSQTRLLDTRSGAPLEPMAVLPVQVSGRAGVPPSGVSAASLNLTITGTKAAGYAVAFPCGGSVPASSNVNYAGERDAANGAVVALDESGRVCVLTSAKAHVLVDVTGWFGATGTEIQASAPIRLADTRKDSTRVSPGTPLRVFTAPGALGGVINVTVTDAAADGYVTVWPCNEAKPDTSALNFRPGTPVANASLAPVNTQGEVCIEPSERAHVVVDRTAVLGLAGSGRLDGSGNVVTDWALTQVGDVYAAMNPYRFGDSKYGKAWDCAPGEASCSKVDTQGKTRTSAAGSFVYDCSGLVVAAWLRAGVDLVKLGASWTEPMLQKLPAVTRETAQVGDLVMFDFNPADSDPVDHVGMYLSPTEMVHAGTCSGGTSAVCRTTINWKNVVAVLRPPMP